MKIKLPLVLTAALSLTAAGFAQESVPLEEAQKAAQRLAASAGTLTGAPFTTERDLDKPQAIKADKIGLLVIPDKRLSAEQLAAAGQTIVPIGELWTLRISVAANGKAAPRDQERLITITDDSKSREVQLYFLGAAKNDKGALQLVVFAKGQEPLLRVPLIKSDATDSAQFPIQLAGRKVDEDTGSLILTLPGQYKADLTMVRPPE